MSGFRFPKDLFLPTDYKLRDSSKRFVINYGGAGSGKSYSTGQHEIIQGFRRKEKVLILRKTGATLRDSVVPLLREQIIPELQLQKAFVYLKGARELINTFTGSHYLFRGLDDPEKLKSIAGITRVWFEEASEFEITDMEQVNLRLRDIADARITLTFNPIDESHWLKKRFFDIDDNDVTIIHSTFLDNRLLPESYVKELMKYKNIDYNFYRVYALGEWGKLDSGAELYKGFKVGTHTGITAYDASLPLHLSFDENVNPYLACSIWQASGSRAWKIDEIALESPMNSLEYTTTEIKKRYAAHEAGMFIYGDATSWKQDTKLEKGYNFFRLIEDQLSQYHPVLRVPKTNPSVVMRSGFIDRYFKGMEPGIEILIGQKCTKSIEDFKYVKQAADGTKLKEKKRDPKTLVTYEPYGHFTDTDEYFICEYFRKEYELYLSGGSHEVKYRLGMRSLRSKF